MHRLRQAVELVPAGARSSDPAPEQEDEAPDGLGKNEQVDVTRRMGFTRTVDATPTVRGAAGR